MFAPSESVLVANCIVFSKDSKKFFCAICPDNPNSDNWENHIDAHSHARKLERFNLMFENRKETFYCKICKTNFNWNVFKVHVLTHNIVPWYTPNNLYKIFFENHMLPWFKGFYCYPCDMVFIEWSAAFVHTSNESHKILLKAQKPENKSLDLSGSSLSYKFLASNSLISWNSTNIACKICDCANIGLQNVDQHVNESRHATGKFKLIRDLKDRANSTLVATRLSDNKISLKKDNSYWCEYCKCDLQRLEQVDPHIKGDDHRKSRWKMISVRANHDKVTRKDKQMKSEITKKPYDGATSDHKFSDYIVMKSSTDFYCTICDCLIINRINIEDHVSGKRHAEGMTKFRVNKIIFKFDNKYCCTYCNCWIYRLKNVHAHIDGIRHQMIMSKNQELPKNNKILNKITIQNEKKIYNYIINSNGLDSYCKICDNKIDANIGQHVIGNLHANASRIFHENKIVFEKDDLYHCNYCDCPIYSYHNVKQHIKGINHSRFIDKSKEANVVKADQVSQNSSLDYVKISIFGDSNCEICDCVISGGQENVDEHVAGKGHAIALKKYGCQNISPMQDTKGYYCKSCDSIIPGIYNLRRHVKSEEHAKFLNSTNEEIMKNKKIANGGLTSYKQMVLSRSVEFAKSSDKLSARRTRNSRLKFFCMIWQKQIRQLKVSVNCNICYDKLKNVVELHSHLACHYADDFVDNETKNNDDETNAIDDNKKLMKSLNSSTESIDTKSEDSAIMDSSRTEKIVLNEDNEPGRLKRTPKKLNIKRIISDLDFKDDHIYSMEEKLRELELGLKLSFPAKEQGIHCLVCRKIIDSTMENYFDHLSSLDHSYYLEQMEKDDALFKRYPEKFSDMTLGLEYMEEISVDLVLCHICEKTMSNVDDALNVHINDEKHSQLREKIHESAIRNFDNIKLRFNCNWYKVVRYRCVPCCLTFISESNFVKHFKKDKHSIAMKRSINVKRQLMIDFCEACALLWYGYRRTCAYHRDIETHVWLLRDGFYASSELPKTAKNLLAKSEDYIEKSIRHYDDVSAKEREKEESLIRDIKRAVSLKYAGAIVYMFGSRKIGVGTPDSDIDVFLDCGNMCDGKMSSRVKTLEIMNRVEECLRQDPNTWAIEAVLKECRCPIIKLQHRPTVLSCDISFESDLAVENTNLIKSFNDAFPLYRKMVIFLKRWMSLCGLSGSDRITSYAIYWQVAFYLQRESIFPSVATLIAEKDKSPKIAGWQMDINFGIRELLVRFFAFWANFDYRYDVACPIIGEIIKKRDFANTKNLPKEIKPYIDYTNKSINQESFRIDSVMCIQDPLDLQYNLTRAVNKVVVNRFRTYCSKSLDILRS